MTSRLGFLSVIEIADFGFSGGLLIVSMLGKPIEFHCTAPTTLNRAQRILYGRTWQSFLCCDQIGMTLIDKARTQPDVFITDNECILPLSEVVDRPLVYLENLTNDEVTPDSGMVSAPVGSHRSSLAHFDVENRKLWFDRAVARQDDDFQEICQKFSYTLPLNEPFERIRHAIEEAQAVGTS